MLSSRALNSASISSSHGSIMLSLSFSLFLSVCSLFSSEEANAEAEARREPPHRRQIEIDSENLELSGARSVIHKLKHFITYN